MPERSTILFSCLKKRNYFFIRNKGGFLKAKRKVPSRTAVLNNAERI